MKTIIIATDFSRTAANAIHYAATLAALNKSKLVLVHAISTQGKSGNAFSLPQLELYYLNLLIQFGKKIRMENGYAFEMEAVCVYGPLSENLNKLVHRKQADLVIMGTKGGIQSNSICGSNTFHYIQVAECPVLVIPGEAPFHAIKNIAYASNFKNEEEDTYIKQLLTFAEPFCSEINIINITQNKQQASKVQSNIQSHFPDILFRMDQIIVDKEMTTFQGFLKDKNIDILAIALQKKYSIENISKQLNLSSSWPLLVLPPHPYWIPEEKTQRCTNY